LLDKLGAREGLPRTPLPDGFLVSHDFLRGMALTMKLMARMKSTGQ
jgi:hypothetical protein